MFHACLASTPPLPVALSANNSAQRHDPSNCGCEDARSYERRMRHVGILLNLIPHARAPPISALRLAPSLDLRNRQLKPHRLARHPALGDACSIAVLPMACPPWSVGTNITYAI